MGLTLIPNRIDLRGDTIRIQLHDGNVAARRLEVLQKLSVTSVRTSRRCQRSRVRQKHKCIGKSRRTLWSSTLKQSRTLQTSMAQHEPSHLGQRNAERRRNEPKWRRKVHQRHLAGTETAWFPRPGRKSQELPEVPCANSTGNPVSVSGRTKSGHWLAKTMPPAWWIEYRTLRGRPRTAISASYKARTLHEAGQAGSEGTSKAPESPEGRERGFQRTIRCSICQLEPVEQQAIATALQESVPLQVISGRTGLAKSSIWRHSKHPARRRLRSRSRRKRLRLRNPLHRLPHCKLRTQRRRSRWRRGDAGRWSAVNLTRLGGMPKNRSSLCTPHAGHFHVHVLSGVLVYTRRNVARLVSSGRISQVSLWVPSSSSPPSFPASNLPPRTGER